MGAGGPERVRLEQRSNRTHFRPHFWPYEFFGLMSFSAFRIRPFENSAFRSMIADTFILKK